MEFLKKFWNWLLGQTTVDEKIEAKIAEIKEEVADVVEEVKDVIEVITPEKDSTAQ